MAEEALKKAGYSVRVGTVFDEEHNCVAHLENGMLTTQPVYESIIRFQFSQKDAICRRVIGDITGNLELDIIEQPTHRSFYISRSFLSIKTGKPEKMPTAVMAYEQLKKCLESIERKSSELTESANEWLGNELKEFSKECKKSILEDIKSKEKELASNPV